MDDLLALRSLSSSSSPLPSPPLDRRGRHPPPRGTHPVFSAKSRTRVDDFSFDPTESWICFLFRLAPWIWRNLLCWTRGPPWWGPGAICEVHDLPARRRREVQPRHGASQRPGRRRSWGWVREARDPGVSLVAPEPAPAGGGRRSGGPGAKASPAVAKVQRTAEVQLEAALRPCCGVLPRPLRYAYHHHGSRIALLCP